MKKLSSKTSTAKLNQTSSRKLAVMISQEIQNEAWIIFLNLFNYLFFIKSDNNS